MPTPTTTDIQAKIDKINNVEINDVDFNPVSDSDNQRTQSTLDQIEEYNDARDKLYALDKRHKVIQDKTDHLFNMSVTWVSMLLALGIAGVFYMRK